MDILTEEELVSLIREVFETKDHLRLDSDLTHYISDSIDLGEMLAALYEKYQVRLNPTLFKKVYTLADALSVINSNEK